MVDDGALFIWDVKEVKESKMKKWTADDYVNAFSVDGLEDDAFELVEEYTEDDLEHYYKPKFFVTKDGWKLQAQELESTAVGWQYPAIESVLDETDFVNENEWNKVQAIGVGIMEKAWARVLEHRATYE